MRSAALAVALVSILATGVRAADSTAPAPREYTDRLLKMEDTAAGHVELAKWCEANDLADRARTHWQEALQRDPDCAEARAALGFVKRNMRVRSANPTVGGVRSANSSFSYGRKISNDMAARGWSDSLIDETISSPRATSPAINKATNGPATAFFRSDGAHVVRDNATGRIIQVSKIGDPGWIPDASIQNPYKP